MARPIIALLTDFGLRDHYVAAMKGVALAICPDVTLVDITHDIPPQDILTAALELAASWKYFPRDTIFLVVVDPGVGSSRRGIAVETADYRFVAPDNGVLSPVLADKPARHAVELTDRKYARPTISRTFEGRDRFAPAAAWLAKGVALTALGRSAGPLATCAVPQPAVSADIVTGEVLRIDRFGNLVTNITRAMVDAVVVPRAVDIGSHQLSDVVSTYADAAAGDVCALIGSSDHLEIAVRDGNAASVLGAGRGTAVRVRRRA